VNVLAVCTGNIFRSPAVERWLAASLTPSAPGLHFSSAGVRAVVGAPIDPVMARFIEARGGRADNFTARQLDEKMLRESALVLALTRAHRSEVVTLFPPALRRTFTLREFARLAALVPSDEVSSAARPDAGPRERLQALIPHALQLRGSARVRSEDDDVIDPVGRPERIVARAASEIWTAVEAIVDVLRGDLSARPGQATHDQGTSA
jgi:protein-tyrosine phosphatase